MLSNSLAALRVKPTHTQTVAIPDHRDTMYLPICVLRAVYAMFARGANPSGVVGAHLSIAQAKIQLVSKYCVKGTKQFLADPYAPRIKITYKYWSMITDRELEQLLML